MRKQPSEASARSHAEVSWEVSRGVARCELRRYAATRCRSRGDKLGMGDCAATRGEWHYLVPRSPAIPQHPPPLTTGRRFSAQPREAHPVVAKRQNWWVGNDVGRTPLVETFQSENNFLSRNLAEPVADAPLCCARAPAHRHAAPRRPRSEFLTWQRLRCPKGSCIGERGEGRWWVRSPANSRTSFLKRQKDYRKIGTEFR